MNTKPRRVRLPDCRSRFLLYVFQFRLEGRAVGGVRGGVAATLGLIAGDQVLMWLAVAGVAALLAAYPPAFHAVQWLGAAYLAWLGLRMIRAKPGDAPVLNIQPRLYFKQAFIITLGRAA